jgi:hypothetical protein
MGAWKIEKSIFYGRNGTMFADFSAMWIVKSIGLADQPTTERRKKRGGDTASSLLSPDRENQTVFQQ